MGRNDKQLEEFPKNDRVSLGKKFFQDLRDRVETIRPVNGKFIKIEELKTYGLKISVTLDDGKTEPSLIKLNVCSNGSPATITVLGLSGP